MLIRLWPVLVVAFVSGVRAQAPGGAGGPAVQVTVTAEGHHGSTPAAVSAKDVSVYSGKDRLEVLDLVPAAPDHRDLQLMILIDDGADSSLGTQIGDIKKFITGLPGGSQVALGYMRDGTIRTAQDFTTEYAAVANKVRLPLGSPGVTGSPYFALEDAIKRWPPSKGRREVLMITDGIDLYGGVGPGNTYVTTAVEHAQRAGIVVHSIFWSGAGHASHRFWARNWGQNYLSQLADGTGGEAYWQGFGNPVSFAPFLEDLTKRLDHQYTLTFRAKARAKPGLETIRIRTEVPNTELVGPTQVWVP